MEQAHAPNESPKREAANGGGARVPPSSSAASSGQTANPQSRIRTPQSPPSSPANLQSSIFNPQSSESTYHSPLTTHHSPASISHDLNNAFTGIIGNLSLLKDDRALPAEVRERLTLIERAAKKAFELTQQLIKSTTNASGGARRAEPEN